jgi:hypothetical protein
VRKSHWLRRVGKDAMPACLLSLGWSESLLAMPDIAGCSYAGRLRSWSIGTLWRTHRGYEKGAVYAGNGQADLLQAIYRTVPDGGPVWLVTCNATYAAGLCGLWDAIDKGSLALPMPGGRPGEGGAPSWHGACVLGDPPTMVHIQLVGERASFVLIDVANWGKIGWTELAAERGGVSVSGGVAGASDELHAIIARDRRQDLTAFLERWGDMLRVEPLGGWRTTAASQGFAALRRHHLTHSVLVHSNGEVLDMEQSSMHCGRQEALQVGHIDGPLYWMDYNSYYPTLASNAKVPVRLRGYDRTGRAGIIDLANEGFTVTGDVTIETASPDYPYQWRGITVWPVGRFRTRLPHPELMHAFAHHRIAAVHRLAWYESEPLLCGLMSRLIMLRQHCKREGFAACDAALKAVANNLFGRLSSRGSEWIEAPEVGPPEPWAQWPEWDCDAKEWRVYRAIANRVFRRRLAGIGPESCPAITAHIWSMGRAQLTAALNAAGRENTVYLGTDALIVNGEGRRRLGCYTDYPASGGLILREVRVLPWIRIYGPGHYEYSGEKCHSGIPEWASGSWEEGYEWHAPLTPEESLLARQLPGTGYVKRVRRRDALPQHGTVRGDGRVDPFNF